MHLWAECRLEFPIYQAILLCLSFFNPPLFFGVPRKELILGWKMVGKMNGSCLHLVFLKCSGFGCARVFSWSQTGGASAKCPPLINHVPAIAAFSVLGAKAPALGTPWHVGQACEALKSSQVTPKTLCCWVRRKRHSSLYIFFPFVFLWRIIGFV